MADIWYQRRADGLLGAAHIAGRWQGSYGGKLLLLYSSGVNSFILAIMPIAGGKPAGARRIYWLYVYRCRIHSPAACCVNISELSALAAAPVNFACLQLTCALPPNAHPTWYACGVTPRTCQLRLCRRYARWHVPLEPQTRILPLLNGARVLL